MVGLGLSGFVLLRRDVLTEAGDHAFRCGLTPYCSHGGQRHPRVLGEWGFTVVDGGIGQVRVSLRSAEAGTGTMRTLFPYLL